MAAPLRVIDLAPMSGFTDEERRAILAEAKRLVAERAPISGAAPEIKPEDPLIAWRAQVIERQESMRVAAEELRREEQRRQRLVLRSTDRQWIEKRFAEERAFGEAVLIEVIGELMARIEKLEKK
jgi:hypothetical protein